MTEEKAQSKATNLEDMREDEEAITSIMELYNCDEATARKLWSRFIKTVEKIKVSADGGKQARQFQHKDQ